MDAVTKKINIQQDHASTIIPNKDEEKRSALNNFTNKLSLFLDASSDEIMDILDDYNGVLILLIDEDQKFRKDLENALFLNQEKLTQKSFSLDGKPTEPTISNWLKDFIKISGGGFFDNLAMTKYVTLSANVKVLDTNEKILITKLLKLYRNLKFFPESQKSVPIEKWEMFPLNREYFTKGGYHPNTETNIEREGDMRSENLSVTEARNLSEVSDKEKMLETLHRMRESFPEGSLERRAVEEEMDKLERQNNNFK